MDELNINPQPEGENPQENQPTPPADQGSFSLDQNQESAPTPEPVQPKGGVLETAEPNQQAMSEQNNPAQMEAPQSAEEQEGS